ncbi:site-specific integrase [Christiangramia flava]|uniref:Transposase n=1 Tax=Christiangramia flava JLT2011 TaxID=1229726 RepID=A0A1L7I892_9FLAO|nr:site-specific integrase [Christiangramia flava]APU69444.1 transposase [Christiangramia flava JLT2011]OSS37955.1 Tyrosine type site-specific recombinase [Christiangramia flava JLT2011]
MPNYTTFSVLFFVRKHHDETKKLFIYARITVDGKRSEISLKRSIPVNQWDASKGRARGTSPKSRILNQYLDQVYNKLLDCHKQLSSENKVISAQSIKARFYGKDDQQKTLLELMDYHNSHMKNVLKPGTLKNYYTTETYLKEFLNKQMSCNDINLRQINYRFVTDFEQFLRKYSARVSRKTCGNNGTMKHLERLKKMLNLAIKLEWLMKNPFDKFKFRFEKNERQYLTKRELQILETTEFTRSSLQKVKDIFVFSCYTGLSYVDIKELTIHRLVKGIDGSNWIYTKREKTDEAVKVPLLPQAELLLNKYRNQITSDDYLFPVCSNQKINKYLKEIMLQLKIKKTITFHSARHTFATTVTLSNGVPIETVSKLLGHSKLSTTQIYARVIDSKISNDMECLKKKLMN